MDSPQSSDVELPQENENGTTKDDESVSESSLSNDASSADEDDDEDKSVRKRPRGGNSSSDDDDDDDDTNEDTSEIDNNNTHATTLREAQRQEIITTIIPFLNDIVSDSGETFGDCMKRMQRVIDDSTKALSVKQKLAAQLAARRGGGMPATHGSGSDVLQEKLTTLIDIVTRKLVQEFNLGDPLELNVDALRKHAGDSTLRT
eukprot:PhF_6_TR40596/c0_g1_i1/m.60893